MLSSVCLRLQGYVPSAGRQHDQIKQRTSDDQIFQQFSGSDGVYYTSGSISSGIALLVKDHTDSLIQQMANLFACIS